MSRGIKILWIVIGCLFVAGAGLTAVGVALGGSGGVYLDRTGLHVGAREFQDITLAESETQAFENIEIELVEADVEIIPAQSYGYEFIHRGTQTPSVEIQGDTLKVTEDRDNWSIGIFNFWEPVRQEAKLTVFVPSDAVLDAVSLSTASGKTVFTGDDVHIESLECKSASGNINLSDLILGHLILDVASGDVSMDSVTAESASINMMSGHFSSNETKMDSLVFNMASGTVRFNGEILKDMQLRMVSGNADFELAGSEEDYSFDVKRVSGDIRVNGRKISESSWPSANSSGDAGSVSGHINIDTTSGSVNINFM